MKSNLPVCEQLKNKYHNTDKITNFKELLDRGATLFKNRTAFKLKNENKEIYDVTYEKLKNDVTALGTFLINKGLTSKRICVIGKNSYKWAISYLASSIVGIVVPIDKELHAEDIVNFMNVSEASAILGDDTILDSIHSLNNKIKNKDTLFIKFETKKNSNFLSFDLAFNNGLSLVQAGNTEFDKIELNPDEMKILLFTSGTTGNAKGVCLSHRNICSNILSIYGIVKVRRNDLFLSILPIHHTYECTIGFLLPLYGGASIAFCDGLRYITNNISEYHPSVVLCVPLLLENMHKKIIKSINTGVPEKYRKENANPFPELPFYMKPIVKSKVKNSLGGRIRVFIVGAAAMNPAIIEDFDSLGLRTLQGYGLTECSPLVARKHRLFFKKRFLRASNS